MAKVFPDSPIVKRPPVVIGISKVGAAPIFGQAIRCRSETLPPPGLAKWAALARDLSEKVKMTSHGWARSHDRHCRKRLAPFKVPRFISYVSDPPRTARRKITEAEAPDRLSRSDYWLLGSRNREVELIC